jgi:hypothetical protein
MQAGLSPLFILKLVVGLGGRGLISSLLRGSISLEPPSTEGLISLDEAKGSLLQCWALLSYPQKTSFKGAAVGHSYFRVR